MENKRSKGVTFWGWFFIILSAFALFSTIRYKPEAQIYGIGSNIIMNVAYLICGIFILKLNEIARKVVIVLSIVAIFLIPINLKPIIDKTNSESNYIKQKIVITEQMKPEFQQKALEQLEKRREMSKKYGPIILMVLFGTPSLIYCLAILYYFTRPKVKEQFKGLIESV
jgi:predicted tellurium resistance membrane protein TerC